MRLLTRLRSALSSGGEDAEAVRAALLRAQAERGRIELEPLVNAEQDRPCYTARLAQVLEDSIGIDMPVRNGVPHPLARYEPHRVILTSCEGCLAGATRVIGRARIPSAGGDILHGYRLEIPQSLEPHERRREPRLYAMEELREAELLVYTHKGPILGRIEDISASGVRLSCRNGHNHLQAGQQAYFRAQLPRLGTIEQWARVIGVEQEEQTGNMIVRLAFGQRVQRIADAMQPRYARRRGLRLG